ncbi:MAG: thiol:disulfide interchange protein DsbA/DsbL [Methylococcales bacterium]
MPHLRFFGIILIFIFTTAIPAQDIALPDVAKGEGYTKIIPPQPTQDANKIEVIDFFWYGCPHCYRFEPLMNEWAKSLPENVMLIRQPAIFSSNWAPGAYAFFVADALGITEQVHAALFNAIQNEHRPLESEDQLADFFAEHGVAKEDFHEAYKSFGVATRMQQAEGMPARYGVTGVPAVVINGKYLTNGTLAKDYPGMISVMNALIQQESAMLNRAAGSAN